jgi:hypothetical protein
MALLSETQVKTHERFPISSYHVYWTERYPGLKGGTAVAVERGIPHIHTDLPPLVSVEATGGLRTDWEHRSFISSHL